jgi:hypothetical protein
VVSTRKQLDDDPKFNTLNKTKTVGFMQRQIENKKEPNQRNNNSSSSIDSTSINISISSIISAGSLSLCRSLFGDGMRASGTRWDDGMMEWDRNRPIFIWMTTVFSIHGSQSKPNSRPLVQQYPVPLCRIVPLDQFNLEQPALVVASLGFGLEWSEVGRLGFAFVSPPCFYLRVSLVA